MRRHGWPLIVVAFCALIGLMVIAGAVVYRYVGAVQTQIDRTQEDFVARNRALSTLRIGILSLAIELRDYLLSSSPASDADSRRRLFERRDSILKALHEADRLIGSEDPARIKHLRQSFESYWQSIEVVLHWTPAEKAASAAAFFRQAVRPSRAALLDVMGEMGALNATTHERRQGSIRQDLLAIQVRLVLVLGVALLLSFLIALFTAFRMRSLEQRTELQRRQAEEAANELRRLSQKLVQAQEEERRFLSRELHDEIGQMLTALKMELGHLREFMSSTADDGPAHLKAANGLAERLLQGVREMARGLRPAILDELGLASALKWHARQFSSHSGIAVNLQVEGNVDDLPDGHRTCVYRVVQEALTNCARHAQAKAVRITLHSGEERLTMIVEDDGIGFDKHRLHGKGLGLLGMEERVRELGGGFAVTSKQHRGTLLRVELPLSRELSR